MTSSEKYFHATNTFPGYSHEGDVPDIPAEDALDAVALLEEAGFTSVGGVLPHDTDSDPAFRKRELANIYPPDGQTILGPYVAQRVTAEGDVQPVFYPRGVMVYAKAAKQPGADSSSLN